ncbi:MAG: gliding motility protein GldM [Ilyomonas sp.]
MALPKEPRQKMINLMYIVLTALLALNVSSEIINAFRTVNNSLEETNHVVDVSTQAYISSLKDKLNHPESREKAAIWLPKAQQAQKISEDVYNYIQMLKDSLLHSTGFDPAKNGDSSYNETTLEASTRILVKQGLGEKLREQLDAYKTSLLGIDPAIKTEFASNLPINTAMPKTQNENNKTWATAYFHMTPTIASLTILSKFQNDVRTAENRVVAFCHNQVGQVQFIYNQFQAFAGTNSQYLMPGQELEITAGVGAFSTAARPAVTVDGTTVPVGADGAALYKTTVGGPGSYTKRVRISFVKPDGTPGVVEKEIQYTVGSPTGASVSADAVKVLYIGLDNPLSISGGSVGDDKVSASIDNGSLTKTGPGKYIARVTKAGKATVMLNVDGRPQPFEFRVKSVPDPIAMVGNSKGGPMRVNDFKAQAGVRAELENFVFEGVQFTVTGYTIVFQANGFTEGLQYRQVSGNRFDPVRDLIERCKPGTAVTIDEIKVSGPGGSRQLPPIQFNLRP